MCLNKEQQQSYTLVILEAENLGFKFPIPSRMWRNFWKFFIPAGSAWFLLIPNTCDGGIRNTELLNYNFI